MSKKAAVSKGFKRKEAEPASALLGDESDKSEDDDGAAGKAAFLKRYKQPVPESTTMRTSGGAQPTVAAEGMVLAAHTQTFTGGGKSFEMLIAHVFVGKTRDNNAPDVIATKVPGPGPWLLPVNKPKADAVAAGGADANDTSPDAPAGGGKAKDKKPKAAPRTLVLPANHRTQMINGIIRCSVYTKTPDGKPKEGVELIVAGMPVEVTGVIAKLDAGGTIWLDNSNVIAMSDGVLVGKAHENIMRYMCSPHVMEQSAILASTCMRGFFGMELAPHQEVQAQAIRRRWGESRDAAVTACEAKALYIRTELGADMEPAAKVMDDHAERLRATNACDLAGGAYFFNPIKTPTPDYPMYSASLYHELTDMEMRSHAMLFGMYDPAAREQLPETFVVPEVLAVEFTPYMNIMNVRCSLNFVGSKKEANAARKEGHNDWMVASQGAAIGLKFDMRKDFHNTTGILVAAKANDMAPALVKYGRWAMVAPCYQREPTDTSIAAPWHADNAFVLDMQASLPNVSVVVDEAFIRKHLMGGGTQYAFEPYGEEVDVLKDKDKKPLHVEPPLKLKDHGYQEITSQTYKIETAKLPADATDKEYRIWWADAPQVIIDASGDDESGPRTNTESGAKAVIEAAAACVPALDPSLFLTQRCAVYVVATYGDA